MHIPVYSWNSYNLIYLLDNFRSIEPNKTKSETDTTTSASVSGSDCEPDCEAVSSAVPLDWFDVLAHSEPTSPFESQSLFSYTISDATQPPSESNYELEPMTALLSCLFCFYSNFNEIEKMFILYMKYLKQSWMQNFTYQLLKYDFF